MRHISPLSLKGLGQHPAFMVLSSATKPDGKPTSHFALSKLWIRRSVTQLPVQKLKDCVNPLAEMPKGDFRGERDLNNIQRRKQWLASWKFMAGIRTKLWQGMQLTSTTDAAWIDAYGYDFSLGHCIQRSAFIGDAVETTD